MGQASNYLFSVASDRNLVKHMTEFREKQRRIQALLERHKLHAVLLGRVSNFAWATCGAGQVYVWNPSITGTKSEDTILVTEQGCQILTKIKDWATIPVEINGQAFFRPAILERK